MNNTTNSQAEIKPVKVGEPLTDQADGNPEPSTSNEGACVETRRRVCKHCGNDIIGKIHTAQYCSIKCRNAYNSYQWAIKNKIRHPGVGSGGNQLGEDNHMYKTGIGSFSKKAFNHYGRICNRCGSTELLLVYHKNKDRTNNDLSNLEVLCKKCHQDHHCIRDVYGRFTQRDSPLSQETGE